ncbi:hypothetical protein BBBOND_0108010 [Babesia bigemina]|uniref:6-Cys domain-containing protein n=1 Tax=Babesia bigemina TaxID=5866 RepID=A0A061D1I4_BABBI|nr:hypothetical protein BBBOND_0108010 [Babesia bigemina]CDR94503.1 hypothetical protein BBBOND_0108010 [Babesia bigemina]|eukprot:XP_012766689.1 hypothetical protein BBBOND_0108010 [Babesia bigemina]
MKYLLVFCAIIIQTIAYSRAAICDFNDPDSTLRYYPLITCSTDVNHFAYRPIICPREVNGIEYVLHPQPTPDEHAHLTTYVSRNGALRSVPLYEVVRSEAENALFRIESFPSQTELHFDMSDGQMFVVTDDRLVFICGPRDLVMSDTLKEELDLLNVTRQKKAFAWNHGDTLTDEIGKLGSGLGVAYVYRSLSHIPLQGCGSRPSPLFAPDNVVSEDGFTGTRSCVADYMSNVRIGFVCEGRIEPSDCFKSLLDENGKRMEIATQLHMYQHFDVNKPWVIAQYFDGLALPSFNGECRCIDPETGHVKARIEIRSKKEYVCDITSKVFRNHTEVIRGPWCSVLLHPGSTLTIRFPIEHVGDSKPVTALRNPPRYLFKTEFRPQNLDFLQQNINTYQASIYNVVSYSGALAGDALELDISQIPQGVVTLKYHADKPLTLKRRVNSFLFHWLLKPTENYNLGPIRAIINVSFAFTHDYRIVGCDRAVTSLFDPHISLKYCSVEYMGNGIGEVYQCTYNSESSYWEAGIRCQPDEELLPGNCASELYDLHSNEVSPLPDSVQLSNNFTTKGFQVFALDLDKEAVSYACICVDRRGYEKSRLTLESHYDDYHYYRVRHMRQRNMVLPYMLLPWREVGLSSEGFTSRDRLMLYDVTPSSITVYAGASLRLYCTGNDEILIHDEYVGNYSDVQTSWLPKQSKFFHYIIRNTPQGNELVSVPHSDFIGSNPGDFKVALEASTEDINELKIELRKGAVLVSKNVAYKKYVPITFVCGKTPEQSEVTEIASSAISSDGSLQPMNNLMGLSIGYTWHIVQVVVETTDPYMQGCGVTYASDELFKPETPKLYDANGRQIGCKIDIQSAKEAAFYCPAPYVLDPPDCFNQFYVDGEVKNRSDISKLLASFRTNHFVTLKFGNYGTGREETLRQTPPLECHCVTVKGATLSTIQIENYYTK